MSKHTPGPWYVEQPYGEPGIYVAGTINTGLIAKLYPPDAGMYNGDKLVTADANARLIAAAPELLAACRAILQHENLHDMPQFTGKAMLAWTDARDLVEEAVTKAEGTP